MLLGVDSFGLTTNNITYAVMGEAMNYWDFFPAEDGWARMPVWGYADVVESKAEGVPEGTRVYGYLPPASHLVVLPDRPSSTDFVDVSPHRVDLPAAYNRYLRTDGNEMYEKENEDYEILLWPLYFTSFLIDDFLDDEDMFGAKLAVLSSASSRTTSALAHLLGKRDGIEVVGLTSPGNVEFTESLGVYDRVVPYEELDSIEAEPAVYVDVAGDAKIRGAVHGHWGDQLKHSAAVGITHKEDLGGSGELAGPDADLLLRSDPPGEALRGLGPGGPERPPRGCLAPLRGVGARLAAGRARLRPGGRRAHLPRAARRQVRPGGRTRTLSLVRGIRPRAAAPRDPARARRGASPRR